jgi:hypothetical protein
MGAQREAGRAQAVKDDKKRAAPGTMRERARVQTMRHKPKPARYQRARASSRRRANALRRAAAFHMRGGRSAFNSQNCTCTTKRPSSSLCTSLLHVTARRHTTKAAMSRRHAARG